MLIGGNVQMNNQDREAKNAYLRNYRKNNPLSDEEKERYKKDPITGKTKEKYLKTEKNRKYLKRYGITTEQFNETIVRQNNVCFICGRSNPSGRALSVDHNHITKKVRKLLCDKCNKGLGHFEDNIIIMERAIQYLKDHQ